MVILSKGKLGGHVSFTHETNCHLYQCVLKYRVKGTPLSYTEETYRVTERDVEKRGDPSIGITLYHYPKGSLLKL